jgi:hypothetical protein
MTPTTFDDRARAATQALLSDATRVPAQASRARSTGSPWRVVAVFSATVLVICVAIVGASLALHSSPAGTSRPETNLSARWKSLFIPDLGASLSSVSCPDATTCVAVDYEGEVVTSRSPATEWTVASVEPAGTELTGVSCADPSLCVAVDQNGDVVTSTNPSGGAGAWILSGIDGAASLTGISCPDEQLCVAVGGVVPTANPNSGNYGVVLTSTDPAGGPGTWKLTTVDVYGLTAISCPSPSLCVALDENGQVATSTDPTGGPAAWKSFGVDQGSADFSAISCPTAFLCVAVDDDGNVATSTDPTGGSSAWTLTNVSSDITGLPRLDSIACPSTTFCVIGALSNSALVSSDPTGGSGSWTPVQVVAQGEEAMFGLSCPSNGFCVGVDGGDNIHIYSNPRA